MQFIPQSRAYSFTRLARLVKRFGSITRVAKAKQLSPTTLIKYLNGTRKRLSAPVCARLDDLYIETF